MGRFFRFASINRPKQRKVVDETSVPFADMSAIQWQLSSCSHWDVMLLL